MGFMPSSPDVWAKRFGVVAIVNALISILWIVSLFSDSQISRTIAQGSIGTWGYLGFLTFSIVGFGGFVGFAFLYYVLPKISGKKIHDKLAWLHLILMEVGTIVSTTLLGIAGYVGGTITLSEMAKGTAAKDIALIVHNSIKLFTIEPIPYVAIFVGLAALGVLLGSLNLLSLLKLKTRAS